MINKKIIGIILVVIIAIVVASYIMGYIPIGKSVYGSEREVSAAITDVSGSVEQIGSIIEDIDRSLGG